MLRDELTGADREVRCRLLVGADGANSRIRRQTGAKPEPPHRTGIAIRAYAQIGPEMQDRLVLSFEDWLRPGYGWVFPLGGGAANIGVGMTVSDHRRRRADLGLLLSGYVAALARRGVHVNGPVVGHRTYRLPHAGFGRHATGRGRVALIGDAASMINPLSGEGIAYGLAAAEILAAACAPALADGSGPEDVGRAVGRYGRRFRGVFRGHFASNYAAHRMLRSRRLAGWVFRAAASDVQVRQNAIELMFGIGRLTWRGFARVGASGRPAA